ncbi:hypothetical protein CRG98_023677 [Punica granatum]|nr:hypothetical protein CRG98_023677 [Punica granatum]
MPPAANAIEALRKSSFHQDPNPQLANSGGLSLKLSPWTVLTASNRLLLELEDENSGANNKDREEWSP